MNAKEKKLAKVLEIVNVGREALGYKPIAKLPKGTPEESDNCPLKRALRVENVYTDNLCVCHSLEWTPKCETKAQALGKAWHKKVAGTAVHLPSTLQRFVHDFDALEYPELVL